MMALLQHVDAMNLLLQSGRYSDLTLACRGQEFRVHRAIVCPRSNFFAAACSGGFKEADLGRIELEDDDPATVERMISYMYTFDYKDEQHLNLESDSCNSVSPDEMMEDPTGEHQSMSHHGEDQPALISSVRVYAIADKYGIPPLKELARDRFSNWAKDNWAREDFSDIVREIFESTPKSDRGLRDIVIQIATIHADVLTQKDKFRQLMEDIGDLGLNLLCELLKIHSEEKSGLESRIEDLEAVTEQLKRELKECERSLKHKSDELDRTMNIINNMV